MFKLHYTQYISIRSRYLALRITFHSQ